MELFFFIFLSIKTSSHQLGVYPLAKIVLYFEILAWSPNSSNEKLFAVTIDAQPSLKRHIEQMYS